MVSLVNSARSYLWWHQIDKQMKETTCSCIGCQSTQQVPPEVPMPRWTRALELWHTLHGDIAGPVKGCTFLILVNAHTKCFQVWQVAYPTSTVVMSVLRSLFATFGMLRWVMSDSGTAFVLDKIQTFCAVTCAPYHSTHV